VSWYQTIKLLECIILATYCTSAIRRFGLPWLLTAFVVGGVVQAGIAVGQLIHQADIGLRILGESVLRPSMTGIASFYTFAGEKLIRAYGTTPHPNVLAMYLALSLSAWWGLYIVRIKTMRLFHRWIFIVAYAVMFWGFFATFSRTVIVLWVCMMMVLVVVSVVSQKIRRHVWTEVMKRWIYGAMLFSVALAALFAWVYWDAVFARMAITGNEEAVTLRLYYNEQALNTGSGMHWTGIGIGNFASWLMVHAPFAPRYLYQPAHNLYLLVYAEMGILGMGACAGVLGVVFFMLFRQWQKEKMRVWYISAVLGLVLMVALFDHFFWTLQQGRLMLWVVVGVIVGQSTRHDS
jgi:O-antigen ligase